MDGDSIQLASTAYRPSENVLDFYAGVIRNVHTHSHYSINTPCSSRSQTLFIPPIHKEYNVRSRPRVIALAARTPNVVFPPNGGAPTIAYEQVQGHENMNVKQENCLSMALLRCCVVILS